MDSDRYHRRMDREPLWGSTRLLVCIVVVATMLGVLVGFVSTHGKGQEQAASPTSADASASAVGLQAPTTSTAPSRTAPPSTAHPQTTKRQPPATTFPERSGTTITTTSARGAPARPRGSILQERGSRPTGVDDLLSPFVGGAGGDSCLTNFTDADFRGPTVAVGLHFDSTEARATEIGIGTPLNICFYRFSGGRTIAVTIVAPTGSTQSFTVCYHCTTARPTSLSWYTVAGQPLGRYQVIATQGTAKATATITVSRQPDRTIYVAGNDGSGEIEPKPPGTVFQISLTGYSPDELVWLLLYRNPDPTSRGVLATYRIRVPLRMSDRGERLFSIGTGPGDPKGCYVFDSIPPAFRGVVLPVDWGNVFCIA
jgi:hypothetical protein